MKRIGYIDWLRGFACIVMFQAHCYDSWLSPGARKGWFYAWSQLWATLPAPLFLLLAGVSSALVTEKLREKGLPDLEIAKKSALRGAEIFGLGLLFRIQEYALGYKWSPWTDLFRVDILNILGLSMILMAGVSWLASSHDNIVRARTRSIYAALLAATVVAMLTPPLWTTWRLSFLPWPVESYVNGVHTFGSPQPWLFPLFPWSAFAFVGLAIGYFVFTAFAKRNQSRALLLIGAGGIAACIFSLAFDKSPIRLYAVYDYWHSNPSFFLMRCGILLILMFLAYAWCCWGLGENGFSPAIQLGKTSLLVYWVHIEFVYGRFSIMPKRGCTIPKATLGLAIIFLAMLALSLLRTRWKSKKAAAQKQLRAQTVATAAS